MSTDRREMLDIVCRTAVVAGEAILKIYAEEFDVRHKTDKTPVTEADLAAERIIVDRLMSAFPDIPCIAEELCESEGVPPCCDRFWAIDPLDGTREFIARNGEFAVLIALVQEGRPVLGVVHGPAVRLTYAACGPGTATRWRNGGRPEPIHARAPADGLVVVHSRSHENSRRLAEFLQDYPVQARKSCGSALKFGVIAAGEADLAAERIIVERLLAAFPDIPCVAEELCEAEGTPPSCDRFWAIDPLDGTREFVAGNGEFAVLIALVEDGRPVLGVVHGPVVGLTYAACGPGTATRRRNGGQPEPIQARSPADGLVVVHSRSHENSRRLAEFLVDYPVRERKSCGSALKFGVIAAGEADLYPRFGTTMEWDTAAGQAILEAAGGRVETLAGVPLAYGKPGFKNDGFLAWGRCGSTVLP